MSMSKELRPVDGFKNEFIKMEFEIKKLLPPHVPFEKFERTVLTAVQMNPVILEADRRSLFNACLKAAQDGLLPDGSESALVVYKTKDGPKVQHIPMIRGIIKKVRNSGELGTIVAEVVYKNDEFDYFTNETGPHIVHKPNVFGDRGDPVGAYALIRTKDGNPYIEVMSRDQIMAVKSVSKAKDTGPWSGSFESEMWRKTVLRRCSKKAPMSSDIESLVQRDDELTDLDAVKTGSKAKTIENDILGTSEPIQDAEVVKPSAIQPKQMELNQEAQSDFEKF